MKRAVKMVKRLKDCKGETIVETLAAMVIIVLAFVVLCGAIVSAANLNATTDTTDTVYSKDATVDTSHSVKIVVKNSSGTSILTDDSTTTSTAVEGVSVVQDSSGKDLYYYYDVK